MRHVEQTKVSGDLYLVPADDLYFEDFRLTTEAPTFVYWKTHPYKDVEVIEWYKRFQLADSFYNSDGKQSCQILSDLVNKYSITHVVFDKEAYDIKCSNLQKIYDDEYYELYTIIP